MIGIEGENFSPEELASFLYNELPVSPCSLKLLPYSVDMDNDQSSFLFEILITFYMEGIVNGHKLYEMLQSKKIVTNQTSKTINVFQITSENLLLCEPWLNSLGFMLFVSEYNANEYTIDQSEYCKIILRDNPKDKKFFVSKKIDKPYHFIMFSNYKPTNKLENIKALFYKPKDIKKPNDFDKIYTIKFKPYNMDTKCK